MAGRKVEDNAGEGASGGPVASAPAENSSKKQPLTPAERAQANSSALMAMIAAAIKGMIPIFAFPGTVINPLLVSRLSPILRSSDILLLGFQGQRPVHASLRCCQGRQADESPVFMLH